MACTGFAAAVPAMSCCSVSLQAHVRQERDILAECSESPFMVHMVASFKDKTHIYMLMECVMGGEFFTYLKVGPLPLHWGVCNAAHKPSWVHFAARLSCFHGLD